MDRKIFLDLCQKYAVLSPHINTAEGVDIPEDMLVRYENFIYYPVAYKLMFDEKGEPMHAAVLKERNANMIREVDLKKVTTNG